jgi:3-deoxy-D-manno-octulosonic-acid transferase
MARRRRAPFSGLILSRRIKSGKEDQKRIDERRGGSRRKRPAGPLAWLHGASVGETVSLLPLVERLVERELAVVVTSGTVTSARVLERQLPPGSIHQFVPLDFAMFGARFLDHWKPDIAMFAESELWPNLILEAQARHIPLVLVNARMSERSFRRWQKLGDKHRIAARAPRSSASPNRPRTRSASPRWALPM